MAALVARRGMTLTDNIDDYPEGIILPVDKPYRWTSADVIRKVKYQAIKHFHKKNLKVGHAGTLDPLATGVLLVCIGKATKLAEELQASPKQYLAGVTFGATTPSYDLEKEIDTTYPTEHITRALIDETIPLFLGEQWQVPPMFSAVQVNGKRAYQLARKGETVELKPKLLVIDAIEVLGFDAEQMQLTIRVVCSKGTYIRALARDIGERLGSGAYLTALRRTRVGNTRVEDCMTIDDFLEKLKNLPEE
jgi:tRNA pseudouridine55 synthase